MISSNFIKEFIDNNYNKLFNYISHNYTEDYILKEKKQFTNTFKLKITSVGNNPEDFFSNCVSKELSKTSRHLICDNFF